MSVRYSIADLQALAGRQTSNNMPVARSLPFKDGLGRPGLWKGRGSQGYLGKWTVFLCLLYLHGTPLSTSQKKVLGFGIDAVGHPERMLLFGHLTDLGSPARYLVFFSN